MKNSMMLGCSHGSASRREILYRPQGGGDRRAAFSLLEVVIALGVITVGIVGILAVIPTALQTGHSAQDETRAAHIAQSVFGSLVAQAPSQFNNLQFPLSDGVIARHRSTLDLTTYSWTTLRLHFTQTTMVNSPSLRPTRLMRSRFTRIIRCLASPIRPVLMR